MRKLVMVPSSLSLDFKGSHPYLMNVSVLRETSGVLVVRCLSCGHKAKLSRQVLARFGLKPDAPISAFVKRLRCSQCGSGSVMAKRLTQLVADQGRQKRRA